MRRDGAIRPEETTRENYQNLANAIIEQACHDYLVALERVRKRERRVRFNIEEDEIRNIEEFFHSDWFRELTDLDGDYLIKRLKGIK